MCCPEDQPVFKYVKRTSVLKPYGFSVHHAQSWELIIIRGRNMNCDESVYILYVCRYIVITLKAEPADTVTICRVEYLTTNFWDVSLQIIQCDSKLLSGFSWPIIFKTGRTK
jgi:hypothetical protein